MMTRRIISLVLAVMAAMTLCIPALAAEPAGEGHGPAAVDDRPEAAADEKDILEKGRNLYGTISWVLTRDGTLTLSGSGDAELNATLRFPDKVKKVVVEPGITGIGPDLFARMGNLTDVSLPESVRYLYTGAFAYCTSLRSIEIPKQETSIAASLFKGCTSLQSVVIPDAVTWIYQDAFSGCTSLKSVTIPASVTKLDGSAFSGCTALERVEIWSTADIFPFSGIGVPGTAVIYCYTDAGFIGRARDSGYDVVTRYRLPAPEIKTAENTAEGIRLAWSAVSGAEKYMLLYRTAGSSQWTELAATAGTSYTWPRAVSGTDYEFCVRCVVTKSSSDIYTSDCGPVKPIRYLAAPVLKTVTRSNDGLTIAWGAVPGAVKYRILRSDGQGGWVKLADTQDTSYTWTGAKSGTTHTFTVCCVSADGSTVTSAYDRKGLTAAYKIEGWATEGGKRYYYVDGVRQSGQITADGELYYLSLADGHMMKGGWITVNGARRFYADSTGVLRTGLSAIGGRTYYFSPRDGHVMKNGVVQDADGKLYYLASKDGHVMKGGWITAAGGRKYYANADGTLKTGLGDVGKRTYYFAPKDGHMMKGGWVTVGGSKYYLAADGHVMKNGLLTVGGKLYYLNASGVMQKNKTITVNGKTYYLGADGVAVLQSNLFKKGVYLLSGVTGVLDRSTLTIYSKSGNTIRFSAWWMNQSALDITTAKISGNKATFSSSVAKGYLTFTSANTVELTVTDATYPVLESKTVFEYYGTEKTYKTAYNTEILLMNSSSNRWDRITATDRLLYFRTDGTVVCDDGWGVETVLPYRVSGDVLYIGDAAYDMSVELLGHRLIELRVRGNDPLWLEGQYELYY